MPWAKFNLSVMLREWEHPIEVSKDVNYGYASNGLHLAKRVWKPEKGCIVQAQETSRQILDISQFATADAVLATRFKLLINDRVRNVSADDGLTKQYSEYQITSYIDGHYYSAGGIYLYNLSRVQVSSIKDELEEVR